MCMLWKSVSLCVGLGVTTITIACVSVYVLVLFIFCKKNRTHLRAGYKSHGKKITVVMWAYMLLTLIIQKSSWQCLVPTSHKHSVATPSWQNTNKKIASITQLSITIWVFL